MASYKLNKGIVDNQIFEEFEEQKGVSLFNHSANCCGIDDFLAIAYTLCPDIIEINGYIFISDLLDAEGENAFERIRRLEEQFNGDKIKIEQWVNSRSLGDFFIGSYNQSMENDKIIDEFSKVLIYFWGKRVKELFPNKNIIIEIGNEIMGELGLSITMYEQL
ncbi:hypothetical protein ABH966_003632 [Lysinibacillus sp. RC46]|uniref:hypothetical protein n=1 Tax=unclassified Lysinibacillus TaxID=2636778 RepID=UPI0035168CB6